MSAWTLRCMEAGQRQWGARAWLAFLGPASHVYGALVQLRTALFASGLAGVRRLPVPVVSVGNLVVGGSGKTPFVEMLARHLHERGHRVAIILRGYRGGSTKPMIICDGQRLLFEPPMAADEAYLLGRHLPGIAVLTGADRYRVGQMALEQLGCEIIVLDDGFQHLRLHRDLDVVLVDGVNPFGYGRLLPAGLLRERPEALARANLLVVTHSDSGGDLDAIRQDLRRHAPTAPIVLAIHRPLGLIGPHCEALPLCRLEGERLVAFSGIGNPSSFEATLVRLGAHVLAHHVFPDHYAYSPADLEAISAAAKVAGASMVVTTEKDMIKLTRLNLEDKSMPLYALSITLELVEGAATLERMLDGALRSSAS
ncbi:MAG: tetraacyldisaccharide 4'-kinase [Candidatus Methylomirabilis sp.]